MKVHLNKVVSGIIIALLPGLCYGSNFNLPPGFEASDEPLAAPGAQTIQPPPTKPEVADTPVSAITTNEPESFVATEEQPPSSTSEIYEVDLKPVQTDTTALRLELSSPRQQYRAGDNLSFSLKSNQDCYLTLINEGTSGKTIVLFPNRERQHNLIQANKNYLIPGDDLLPIKALKISKPDNPVNEKEKIIAICRLTDTQVFSQPYRFDEYPYFSFDDGKKWQELIQSSGNEQEARKILAIGIN